MKKLLIILLLFPLIVLGKEMENLEFDNVYLKNANVRVIFTGKSLSIEKQLNTQIIYGEKANTYYLDFYLPNTYNMYNAKKNIVEENSADITKLNVESQTYFEDLEVEKGKLLRFGEDYGIFPETENIVVSYDLEFNMDLENYSFPIYFSDYNTDSLIFSLYLNKKYAEKEILFSLNNKDFSKEIDGLSLNSKESTIIYGKYNKKLNKGDSLYLLITNVNTKKIIKNNNLSLVLTISFIVVFSVLICGYLYKRKKIKKN